MKHARLPPHAYIPGRTPRHPDDWFDDLKQDRKTALTVGLLYFDAGFYWECHELLETVWMDTPNPSAERDMVQAVIQLANARLKLIMERPKATARLCDMVADLLARLPKGSRPYGLDPEDWSARLAETQAKLV